MFSIAKWYNNFQAPAVLMIDDLSDAYINVYKNSYKNDWGYLCDSEGSLFSFFSEKFLSKFPYVKITFFTPYLRHNVINENSSYGYKKFNVGERNLFSVFLRRLQNDGHEIAHHGSNHGKYINNKNPSTVNNWIHEWALFDDTNSGIQITLEGVKVFKDSCNISIVGGKYCGYITRDNSQEIIDKCNFLYWCDKPSYNVGDYDEGIFGNNKIISFPTNFSGNSFVRLTYLSGHKKRDKKKKIFKYLQPIYNIYSYFKLYFLYKKQKIISVQEHYSPSTSAGTVQSANVITDLISLNKTFKFLNKFSIWYANCSDIAKYIYTRENSELIIEGNQLVIIFKNKKKLLDTKISILSRNRFYITDENDNFASHYNNKYYVINLPVSDGENIFTINH